VNDANAPVSDLDATGAFDEAPWVREAMQAVPREEFAPDVVWRDDGNAHTRVDRHANPTGWSSPSMTPRRSRDDFLARASLSIGAPARCKGKHPQRGWVLLGSAPAVAVHRGG